MAFCFFGGERSNAAIPRGGGERSNAAPSTHYPSKGGERSNAADMQAVRRRTTVTHAPRSRARLRVLTNSRDSWRSHVHRTYTAQRVQSFKLQTHNVNFLWVGVREGYLFFKKRYPSLYPHPPASMQENYQLLRSRKFRCLPKSLWQHKRRSRTRARENA